MTATRKPLKITQFPSVEFNLLLFCRFSNPRHPDTGLDFNDCVGPNKDERDPHGLVELFNSMGEGVDQSDDLVKICMEQAKQEGWTFFNGVLATCPTCSKEEEAAS